MSKVRSLHGPLKAGLEANESVLATLSRELALLEGLGVAAELGADPTIRDALHSGTPAGWAQYGCHPELAERLT